LVALRRRGFLPESIKNFVLRTGISKAEATMTWDDLIMENKRLLDQKAKRYSAIFDPVQIEIENPKNMSVELHLNPNEKKGGRKFKVDGNFIISRTDIGKMKDKEITRLMDCINVMKDKGEVCFNSIRFEDFKGKGKNVINWLPNKGNIKVEVTMPDKTILKGLAEHNISSLKQGEVIQFERFGFCRLDKIEKDTYKFWFTHK
jgi:glutamyl-tRNA synthetase